MDTRGLNLSGGNGPLHTRHPRDFTPVMTGERENQDETAQRATHRPASDAESSLPQKGRKQLPVQVRTRTVACHSSTGRADYANQLASCICTSLKHFPNGSLLALSSSSFANMRYFSWSFLYDFTRTSFM